MIENKKGFTLVELIVTITILAILATIAFFYFQGFSASARNSKRILDISSLSNTVLIKHADGTSPLLMVGGADENKIDLAHISVGGVFATDDIYDAGIPNYQAFGIKKENFLDPLGDEYRIGSTTTYGGRYEIATVLEIDNIKQSVLKGSYSARGDNDLTLISASGKIAVLEDIYTNSYKKGDTLATNTGSIVKIVSVGSDKVTLTLDNDVSGAISLKLAQPETQGLIAGKDDNTTIVTHESEILFPY